MKAHLEMCQWLTAVDLMNRDLTVFSERMPLSEAVRELKNRQIGGAPVVNGDGRCVGIFSISDLSRLAATNQSLTRHFLPARPLSCSFQKPDLTCETGEKVLCTLPAGACPIQVLEQVLDGGGKVVCNQPHCVLVDWQNVELEKLPLDEVRQFMTSDPVMAAPETPLRELARMMIDAHIHRIVVANKRSEPLGIVSMTDLVAILARDQESAWQDLLDPVY